MSESETSDYEVIALPALNHLFQTSRAGNRKEYEEIEETFAPAALDALSGWLSRHVHLTSSAAR